MPGSMLERRLTVLAVAAAFSTLFVLVGWREIHPAGFPDLENYRAGFNSNFYHNLTQNRSPLGFFLSESAWFRIVEYLNLLIRDIDTTFTVISVTSLMLVSIYILRATQSAWCLLFCINPAFVNLVINQLRAGLAAGLFWMAVSVENRFVKLGLVLAAASMHTVFLLFGTMYLIYYVLRESGFGQSLLDRPVPLILGLIVFALVVSLFRDVALAAIGNYRAHRIFKETNGVYLSIAWATFIATYALLRKERQLSFEAAFYAFCVAMAFISALSGVYGSRFAAMAIPALATFSTRIDPQYRLLFGAQYAAFTAVYFLYWSA